MYTLSFSSRFKKHWKNYKHISKIEKKLKSIMTFLRSGGVIPKQLKDHKLKGRFIGYRELHLFPDLVIVYKINEETGVITLSDIGSHSELF